MSQRRHLPETMGPGAAFFDYDNDGWMDLYLVNAGPCDFYTPSKPLRNALYRNNRDGTFHRCHRKGRAYPAALSAWALRWEIMITTAGLIFSSPLTAKCILYKNNRNGTFTDVTEKAGLATPGWTTSAVWFDYDCDGKLDLFVCSFVDYSPAIAWAAATTRSENISIAFPKFLAHGEFSLSQQWRRHIYRSGR